jgi:nuclear pore complex protein Nup93
LRVGDFVLASKVASNLQNLSNCSILIKILAALNSNQLVDGDRRFQLNAEWKHVMSSCQDPYKRAVYAMILGHECPEVNNSIENWLWSRLMNCKLDPVNGLGHFYKLQTTICVDYGEEYFVGSAGKYAVYFTVLWLTGQLERAIDLLFRAEQRQHAVHIAILAYQLKLLNISAYSSSPICKF